MAPGHARVRSLLLALFTPLLWSAAARADEHRVLSVLVKVAGRRPLRATRAQVARAIGGAEDSVAVRFKKMSYGQLSFTASPADVVGPITVVEPPDFCETGYLKLADAADAAVRQSGVDVSSYDHVAYVIPSDVPCWWTGLGIIGGRRVWVKATTVRAFQHELGHNLGLDHALRWTKTGAEESDIMGSASTGLNAPHVAQLNWLASFPGKQIEVTSATTLTLEPLEGAPAASSHPKIAIVRPASGANTYYLSYRKSTPSSALASQYLQGVNIHIFNGKRIGPPYTYFVGSLHDGEVYRDGPLVIRQLAHVPGEEVRLKVDLSGEGLAMAAGAPPAAPGTIQSVATGKCLDVSRGSLSDGAAVIQYDCHDGANQSWRVAPGAAGTVQLVNAKSGKCLAIQAGGARAGSLIEQATCAASDGQVWRLEPDGRDYAVRDAASRLCVDIPRGSQSSGVQVALWKCSGSANQRWRFSDGTRDASRTGPGPNDGPDKEL